MLAPVGRGLRRRPQPPQGRPGGGRRRPAPRDPLDLAGPAFGEAALGRAICPRAWVMTRGQTTSSAVGPAIPLLTRREQPRDGADEERCHDSQHQHPRDGQRVHHNVRRSKCQMGSRFSDFAAPIQPRSMRPPRSPGPGPARHPGAGSRRPRRAQAREGGAGRPKAPAWPHLRRLRPAPQAPPDRSRYGTAAKPAPQTQPGPSARPWRREPKGPRAQAQQGGAGRPKAHSWPHLRRLRPAPQAPPDRSS